MIITKLDEIARLIASMLYGCGMRLTEVLLLRVKDIDFEMRQTTVRGGQGVKSPIDI